MRKIVLTGAPISTQHAYGQTGNRRYMTTKAKNLKESYQWEAKSQWKDEPLECDLFVDIVLYFKDKRRRDWDNWHKISQDSLEGIVYKDDSQIQEAHVIKAIDKNNPRIEICINTDTMCDLCGKIFNTRRGMLRHREHEYEQDK